MKLALLFLGLCATPVLAYDTRFALTGARVRITASERAFEGILLAQDHDTLRVATAEGEQAIPMARVDQFRVQTERGNGSKEGFLVGFLVGAVWGGISGGSCDCGSPVFTGLLAAGLAGTVGGGVGALVGMTVPVERWQEVPR